MMIVFALYFINGCELTNIELINKNFYKLLNNIIWLKKCNGDNDQIIKL